MFGVILLEHFLLGVLNYHVKRSGCSVGERDRQREMEVQATPDCSSHPTWGTRPMSEAPFDVQPQSCHQVIAAAQGRPQERPAEKLARVMNEYMVLV